MHSEQPMPGENVRGELAAGWRLASGMLFSEACRTTRSAINGVSLTRRYVGPGMWCHPKSRNAWWKTPMLASMRYVLVPA